MSIKIGSKKVLVRSRYREVVARTKVDYDEVDGKVKQTAYYRNFHEYHAWMTPEEAKNLVESDENLGLIDAGRIPIYSYPSGSMHLVDANQGGQPLLAPKTESGLSTTDVRQATAARKQQEDAKEVVAAKKKSQKEPIAAGE